MKKLLTLSIGLLLASGLFAQVSEETTTDENTPAKEYVDGTFPNIWVVNQASCETDAKREMTFRIHHRLGNIRGGLREFFGIDSTASIYLGLDYGITDNLSVGIGRSSAAKLLDGWAKYRILRQEKGGGMPITLTGYAKANMTLLPNSPVDDRYGNIAHRMSYMAQIIVARKFGEAAAIQIAPTIIHHNLTQGAGFSNTMFGATAAARVRLSKRLSISAEYGHIFNSYLPDAVQGDFKPSLGLSLDMMTGGHVFQIVLSNSFEINEAMAIPYTRNDWLKGDIHIGFNIMRSFWL